MAIEGKVRTLYTDKTQQEAIFPTTKVSAVTDDEGNGLNTLFEHKNCVSIKPFYYKKEDGTDNYIDIIQNINRNFTDMKLMRDRVVNKTFCVPLPQMSLNSNDNDQNIHSIL